MNETIVYTFSEFQVQFLRGLFYNESNPEPHKTKVERIARTSDGAMIVEYVAYGSMQTQRIDYNET